MTDIVHVPTTAQVRSAMAATRTRTLFDSRLGLTVTRAEQIALKEFDRWHAEELRQAKEAAWDEGNKSGYKDGQFDAAHPNQKLPAAFNPYRSRP